MGLAAWRGRVFRQAGDRSSSGWVGWKLTGLNMVVKARKVPLWELTALDVDIEARKVPKWNFTGLDLWVKARKVPPRNPEASDPRGSRPIRFHPEGQGP